MQGFYDPVNEKLIEPKHPGISYSFTADGFYEAAYYRAIANRMSTPRCSLFRRTGCEGGRVLTIYSPKPKVPQRHNAMAAR
jgi:hypothetical protein